MSTVIRRYFLTLVSFVVLCLSGVRTSAAIDTPTPNLREHPSTTQPTLSDSDRALTQTLDVAPPPPLSTLPEEEEYFHRYRKALTLHVGGAYLTSTPDEASDIKTPGLLGALYTFPDWSRNSWEIGADLLSNGTGQMHLSRRFNFSRTRFRPYGKAGAGIVIIPADQLVTFLRLRHYQLRAAAGFEQLLSHTRDQAQSLRLEIEVALTTETTQLSATLGYVWAW